MRYRRAALATCRLLVTLLLLALAWPHGPAVAASPEPALTPLEQLRAEGDRLPPEVVDALVARLSDEDVRALLLDELGRRAAATAAAADDMAGMMMSGEAQIHRLRRALVQRIAALPTIPAALAQTFETVRADRPLGVVLGLLPLAFAAMLLVGGLLEWGFRAATRGLRPPIEVAEDHVIGRLGRLLFVLALDLAGLVLFTLGGLGFFFLLYQGHEESRAVFLGYFSVIVATRAVVMLACFVFAPRTPAWRLTRMDGATSALLYRRTILAAAVIGIGLVTTALMAAFGPPGPAPGALGMLLSFVFLVLVVEGLIRARHGIAADLADVEGAGPARRHLAMTWPWLLAALTVGLWLLYQVAALLGHPLPAESGLVTLAVLFLTPFLWVILEREGKRPTTTTESGIIAELRLAVFKAGRGILLFVAVLLIAGVWGLSLRTLAEASLGARVAGALIDLGLIILLSYFAWQFVRIAIDRRLAAEAPAADGHEHGDMGGTGVSRLATLLPLLRLTLQITILVMAVMLCLSALGVNIGPLLAGAGVVGLAVGFGAQTLVRDIISGVFYLVDDAFRVGEYIDIGTVKGTVEKISIRSFRLRHQRGAIHTIPFGSIGRVTNYSRDWVIEKLQFRLPFDTDVELVRRIFKKIGKDLLAHPEFGKDFIDQFKSQGVYGTDDDAVIMRAKFMCRPGKQFVIRREIYKAVQQAFAENGIKLAPRAVRVQVSEGAELSPEELGAAALRGTQTPQAAE